MNNIMLFFIYGVMVCFFSRESTAAEKRKEPPPSEEKQVQKKQKTEQIVLQVVEQPVEVQVDEPQQVITPLKVYLAENKEMEITDSATINLLNSLQTIKNMQEGSMEVENSNAIDIYLENISAKTCRQVISYLAGELLTDVLDMTDLGLLINAFNYLNPADAIILDRLCAVYAKRVEKIDNLAIFPSEIVKKITSSILVPVVSYVHTCLGNELLGNFDNYLEKRLEVLKLYSSQKNIITMHGGNSQYLFYVILQSPEDLTTAVYICENVAKKMTILPIKGEVVHVSPDGTLITSSMRDAVIPWKIRFFVTDVLAKKCYDMGMHDNCLAGAFKKGQELRFFLAGKNSTSEKNIFLFKIDTDSNNHKILWQCKREQLTKIKTDLSHILFNHQGTIVALGVNLSNPARTTKMIFIDMEDETDIKSMGDANMKCIELVSSSYLIPVSMLSNQSDICVTSIGCAFLYTYIFSYSKQKRTQKKKIDSKSMILRTIPTFNCLDAARRDTESFFNYTISLSVHLIENNKKYYTEIKNRHMSFIDFFPWIMTKITVVNRYAMRFSCPQLFLNQEQGYLFLVDNEKKNIHVIKLSNYPDYSAIHTFFSQLVPEEVLYVQKVYKAQVNENKKLIPMTIFEGEKSQEEKIVEKIKSKPIGNIIMKCLLE